MLLEELVQQHRVHRFVADRVGLPLAVSSHQVRVDLFHLLGHKAELRDAVRVKLVLVTEGYRFERENRFARLVHRFDCILESLRGNDSAELTLRVDNNTDASRYSDPANSGDERGL